MPPESDRTRPDALIPDLPSVGSGCGPLPRSAFETAAPRGPLVPAAQIHLSDIRKAFEPISKDYPPVLSLDQAAAIAGVADSTLKRHVSEGRYKDSVARGKPLRFWRDKFVQEVMRDK